MNQLKQLKPEKGISLVEAIKFLFSAQSFCLQFVYYYGPLTLYGTDSSHDLGSNNTLGNVKVRLKMTGPKLKCSLTYSKKFYH